MKMLLLTKMMMKRQKFELRLRWIDYLYNEDIASLGITLSREAAMGTKPRSAGDFSF